METLKFNSWPDLKQWLAKFKPRQKRFAFRGQADSGWALQTRLARHFWDHHVADNEWRAREKKMYCGFRTQLLITCPGMYDDWDELNILSLMQHHGAPTRCLDFSYDPKVAAYFALEDSRGESAIWVVDCSLLQRRRKERGFPAYCGPTHHPRCSVFRKYDVRQSRLVGSILQADRYHGRLVAQRGCFFVPGAISRKIANDLVHTKVKLSKSLVVESLEQLKADGYEHDTLFPDLDRIARHAKRSSVIGGVECACGQGRKD